MKVLCEFHQEETPSMELYPDGYHCFGCGANGPLSELQNQEVIRKPRKKPVENLQESLEYIHSLPLEPMRGLMLPADSAGYYIVWPDGAYFKKRYYDETAGKYRCPTGHQKPLLRCLERHHKTLLIVEGELNALSFYEATPYDCVSPGGVSEFTSSRLKEYMPVYEAFEEILILTDLDVPGMRAAFELEYTLRKAGLTASSHLMRMDANDILVKYGKEALKEEIDKALEVSRRVRGQEVPLHSS